LNNPEGVAAVSSETSAQMAVRDPDVRLMLRVRDADDAAAFGELVERFQQRLVGIMHHLVGRADEADDLAQEVFLRVYRTRKRYHPQAKFSTWLFTIANNLALNALRSRRRKPVIPLPAQESGPLGPRPAEKLVAARSPAPGQRLQQQELAAIIRAALESLNERQRMAVVLHKFEEMNYLEIAEIMGLSTKAVKSLLSRARAALRDALQAQLAADSTFLPFQSSASANGDSEGE
jgi:RNA polymerase sigma-70 factor (ECF subfamily)